MSFEERNVVLQHPCFVEMAGAADMAVVAPLIGLVELNKRLEDTAQFANSTFLACHV